MVLGVKTPGRVGRCQAEKTSNDSVRGLFLYTNLVMLQNVQDKSANIPVSYHYLAKSAVKFGETEQIREKRGFILHFLQDDQPIQDLAELILHFLQDRLERQPKGMGMKQKK